MKKRLLGLSILILLPSISQAADKAPTLMAPLKATITQTQELPPDMYGGWSIEAYLVETNLPNFFKPVINDLWTLERIGEQVIISNPATGASASINVDKVEGNTATFHRRMVAANRAVFAETPTITVDGDKMNGFVVNSYEEFHRNGQPTLYFAKYQLSAKRIISPRVQFGQQSEPDFDIEDIQPMTPNNRR